MKKLIALSILLALSSTVFAGDFFQTTNPFPQTMPETLNNIYESTPAVMQQEQKKAKKYKIQKDKKLSCDEYVNEETSANILPIYPAAEDSSKLNQNFYKF